MKNPLILAGQRKIEDDTIRRELRQFGLDFEETPYLAEPKYLGILPDLTTSYYIGADWLKLGEQAVVVKPSIENIDFIDMFCTALSFPQSAYYFTSFYGIKFDEPRIAVDSDVDVLTPLLLIHYIYVLKRLLAHGLKHDYILRYENLQGRVRGRLDVRTNIRVNNLRQRYDRISCRYQEYSENIPENRLLKRALLVANSKLGSFASLHEHKKFGELNGFVRQLLTSFGNVSDDIRVNEVRTIKTDYLHREYGDALKLAKKILRRFDYSIAENKDANFVPPYWIDMARLYEVYVYSKLYAAFGDDIEFQVKGYGKSAVDFIKTSVEEPLIIDAKFKPRYAYGNNDILADIREIAGYARDERILHRLKWHSNEAVKCLIIYPEPMPSPDEEDISECRDQSFPKQLCTDNRCIKGFQRFYKLSVSLPKK